MLEEDVAEYLRRIAFVGGEQEVGVCVVCRELFFGREMARIGPARLRGLLTGSGWLAFIGLRLQVRKL